MRLLWSAKDYPEICSAYGKCLREIIPRVAKKTSHEIALFATVGIQYWQPEWKGIKVYCAADNKITGEDIIKQHYDNWKADAYILQMDAWPFTKLYEMAGRREINLFQYMPVDFSPFPQYIINRLQNISGIIAMTHWAELELKKAGLENVLGFIPHGIDSNIYKPLAPSREKIRKKFAKNRLQLGATEDQFLISIIAANQDRKAWFEWLKGISIFVKNNPDIKTKVYVHSPLQMAGGYNIPGIANLLGINHLLGTIINPYNYAFGLVGEEEMARIYNVSDVSLIPNIEGFCCLPDTFVFTSPKIKPILEVCKEDKILTHKGTFEKVDKVFKRDYNGTIIKIKPYHFPIQVSLTPEHLVFAIKKKIRQKLKGSPEWIEAEKLERGDIVLFPVFKSIKDTKAIKISNYLDVIVENGFAYVKGRNQFGNEFKHSRGKPLLNKIVIDNDFMKIAGWYIAEGSCYDRAIIFSLNSKEKDNIREVKKLMLKKFGLKPRIVEDTRHRYSLWFHSSLLGKLFPKLFGRRAKNKKCPEWFLYLPKNKLKSLIECLWKGDGCIKNSYKLGIPIQYSTISATLAYQLFLILTKLNILPSLGRFKRNKRWEYNMMVSGKQKEKFGKIINYKLKVKKTWARGWLINNFAYLPIKNITKEKYNGKVYDLRVKNHSFVTSFVVHNSMPTIESMACGCPVIGLDYGAQKELISPVSPELLAKVGHEQMYGNLLVKPIVSADDIAKKLEVVANDRDKWFHKASRYAFEFDWDNIVKNGWLPMLEKIETRLEEDCYKIPSPNPSAIRVVE